ncbi:Endonuclease/exonuclease/phosphatase [Gorgonomyces haynaldii]|nr:Endonuclease/exonuclease/phosphatase [Gorgonomyces haynaldii]
MDAISKSIFHKTRIEQSVTLVQTKRDGERRRRIACLMSHETQNGASVMIWKLLPDQTAHLVLVLPVYCDFRLSLSKQETYLVKFESDSKSIQLEAGSIDELRQFVVGLQQKMLYSQTNKLYKDSPEFQWLSLYQMPDSVDFRPPERGSSAGNMSNPFIQTDTSSPTTMKMVKEAWSAKQLRERELQFSNYSKLRLFTGTWNLNGQDVQEQLNGWLNEDADIIVLGFQELDLSTEAYLIVDTTKEDALCESIEIALSALPDVYSRITTKRLIGMFIVVYCKRTHYPFVHDVSAESVGTGILGMMGNKGATAVRIKIFDSFVTIVNAHMAADTSMVERRNQDFQDICRRLVFPLQPRFKDYGAYCLAHPWVPGIKDAVPSLNGFVDTGISSAVFHASSFSKSTLTLFDTDHLIWIGDLNYRVNLGEQEAKELIAKGQYKQLLEYDQLEMERIASRVFCGFEEAPVQFSPTYKYDVGTNVFDTSEKKRAPSWCDRILWFRNPLKFNTEDWITCKKYGSCMELTTSDHKPVYALFDLTIRKLDPVKLSKTSDEISRELDRFENDAIPDLVLNQTHLHFEETKFNTIQTKTVLLKNKGQVIGQFKFVPAVEGPLSKPWCRPVPLQGALMPGESLSISISVLVDEKTVHKLNSGKEGLDDILVLHTVNGKDLFIPISGNFNNSSFGVPLVSLVRMLQPVRSYNQKDFLLMQTPVTGTQNPVSAKELSKAFEELNMNPVKFNPLQNQSLSIPKELWRLCDFIYRNCRDTDNIFAASGDPQISDYIRECLDTGIDFDEKQLFRDAMYKLESSPSKEIEPMPLEGELVDVDGFVQEQSKNAFFVPKGKTIAVHSFCDTLLLFLKALPEPLILPSLQKRIVQEGYLTLQSAKQVLGSLPNAHYYTFIYLMSFFQQIVQSYTAKTPLDPDRLANLLLPLVMPEEASKQQQPVFTLNSITSFFYPKPVDPQEVTPEQARKRKLTFIKHFLQ